MKLQVGGILPGSVTPILALELNSHGTVLGYTVADSLTGVNILTFCHQNIPSDVTPNDRPNYIIQETDYTSYSVVYSCQQLGSANIQTAWILTREAGVAPPNLAELESNLEAAGVDVSHFFVVGQTDCPDR
ncbi:apolipoprotein d [Plakobranchus ocellatus]|uniref:Apolipoprotein d n=1 Tax=Plakobranchus ocellatus TaxID=259542 RepID=A0AAV4C0B6_9GAST|nr:apolipoprotein d [Plakobranchus ocellatus]